MRLTVVALVPAKDRADSITATVEALQRLERVDRVLVIDDGSTDATAEAAFHAGADVLRLRDNHGKGGAVLAGAAHAPDADVFLLIDADLAATASAADRLIDPVVTGAADLTIGVLPSAGKRGGFGNIRRLAAQGIRRACGLETTAPLSGQRAIRAELLRGLPDAEKFGLEVAMTIDAQRRNARILEIDVPMDHRHTGRTVAGFRHRGGQGVDIVRSLWPRVTSSGQRGALVAGVLVLAVLVSSVAAIRARPDGGVGLDPAQRVVVFGMPRTSLEDLTSADAPNLARLAATGAVAAMNIRTNAAQPSTTDAYVTLSAGARGLGTTDTHIAVHVDGPHANGPTGPRTSGEIVVVGAEDAARVTGQLAPSVPGALAQSLAAQGLATAVVGNADKSTSDGQPVLRRPAAAAAMDPSGAVAFGAVDDRLLVTDASAPYGLRTETGAFLAEARRAIDLAAFTVLDPGELDRAAHYEEEVAADPSGARRRAALRRTDDLLGAVVAELPPGTLLLVTGLTPPTDTWELTPVIATGPGVVTGRLHSASTHRNGLVTLPDLSATIAHALGVPVPPGMIGRPLQVTGAPADLGELVEMNDIAIGRERIYLPMTITFVAVQAITYLLAIALLSLGGITSSRVLRSLRFVVVVFAAWPLATFVVRIVPALMTMGWVTHAVVWLVAAGIGAVAARRHGHPLAPLQLVSALTFGLLLLDVATGARLLQSSILGYSAHSSSRFIGFGNTAFAVLASCALAFVAIHVDRASRRRDAVVGAAAVLTFVVVADVAPWLGSDVGGLLSLVPVGVLLLVALTGRRITARTLLVTGALTALVLAAVIGVDLLRAPMDRTHLAGFVTDSSGDSSVVARTLGRRWSANVRGLGESVWMWLVPITAVFGAFLLVAARGWRLLPAGSPRRAGVVALLATGVLGWLVNDSGVVITALSFVYLAPLLTLLVVADRLPEAELRLHEASAPPTTDRPSVRPGAR